MDDKQLVWMGAKISNTYAACMGEHCLHLFIALAAYLGDVTDDDDAMNAYAPAEGPSTYIAVDEVFQAWYSERFDILLPLGTCVRVCKAVRGRPSASTFAACPCFHGAAASPMVLSS
jgi:hypothetical protein